MSSSRMFLMIAGVLMVVIAGGCKKNGTGPQSTQYPTNPVPANEAANQPLHVTLSWQDGDADHPAQSWDVCFGHYNGPPTVSSSQTATSYDPGTLSPGTTYHWNVVARYADGGQTRGPEWTFTTGSGAAKESLPPASHPAEGR
jgi:hypothetical protein